MKSELLAVSCKTQPIYIIQKNKSTVINNTYSSEYPPSQCTPPKEDMFNKLIRQKLQNSKLLIHDNYYNIYQL